MENNNNISNISTDNKTSNTNESLKIKSLFFKDAQLNNINTIKENKRKAKTSKKTKNDFNFDSSLITMVTKLAQNKYLEEEKISKIKFI